MGVDSSPRPDALHAGIGLRHAHYADVLATRPAVAFLEVHSENYFGDGGRDIAILSDLRRDYPISLHGVGLSLGQAGEASHAHLERLARLVDRIEPRWVSEHLCWGADGAQHWNELLPLPYTEAALDALAARIEAVQTRLRRQILVENISAYLTFRASEMGEFEFLAELARRTGCGVLLDLNNAYVNAINHAYDVDEALAPLPLSQVQEIHLAGHTVTPDALIDTHATQVCEPVWALYARTQARAGRRIPTLIEWDADLPALAVLLHEAARADHLPPQPSRG